MIRTWIQSLHLIVTSNNVNVLNERKIGVLNSDHVDHIDPRKNPNVCGLNTPNNLIVTSPTYNREKCNGFVPYRVCDHPSPTIFGDTGEFLIEGEWKVCEFGGKEWRKESRRLGDQRIHLDRTGKEITKETRQKQSESNWVGEWARDRGQTLEFSRAGWESNSKVTLLKNLSTGEITQHKSLNSAARSINGSAGALCKVVKGERNHHKGYTCWYEEIRG